MTDIIIAEGGQTLSFSLKKEGGEWLVARSDTQPRLTVAQSDWNALKEAFPIAIAEFFAKLDERLGIKRKRAEVSEIYKDGETVFVHVAPR